MFPYFGSDLDIVVKWVKNFFELYSSRRDAFVVETDQSITETIKDLEAKLQELTIESPRPQVDSMRVCDQKAKEFLSDLKKSFAQLGLESEQMDLPKQLETTRALVSDFTVAWGAKELCGRKLVGDLVKGKTIRDALRLLYESLMKGRDGKMKANRFIDNAFANEIMSFVDLKEESAGEVGPAAKRKRATPKVAA